MTQVYIGDVGTEIVVECGVDVSAATVRKIVAQRQDGSVVEWAAVANTSTSIKYVTLAGDFNQAGFWKIQAYVEMPGWKGHGATDYLTVTGLFA